MPRRPMSNGNKAELREGMRERAFGQDYHPTVIDRFGVWLSARQIRKYAGGLAQKSIGDFGCGYNALTIPLHKVGFKTLFGTCF